MEEPWVPKQRYHKNPNLTAPPFPDFESPAERKGLVGRAKKGGNFEEEVLKRLDGARLVKVKAPPKSLPNEAPPFWREMVEKSDLPNPPKAEFPQPMLVERLKPTPLPPGALYPGNPAVLHPTPHSKALFADLFPQVVRLDEPPPLSTRTPPRQSPNVLFVCQQCQQSQPISQLKYCSICQGRTCQSCRLPTMDQCPLCKG